MATLENEQVENVTRSDLSDWSGVPTLTDETPNEAIRLRQEQVVPDVSDLTNRLFDLCQAWASVDFFAIGPSGTSLFMIDLAESIVDIEPINVMQQFYAGLVWDEVEVTFSLSDPKGIAGAVVIGYYPFVNWFGDTIAHTVTHFASTPMMLQNLMLAPEAQMITFSQCQDVKFHIPWQFNTPWLAWPQLNFVSSATATQMPPIGMPMFFVNVLSANYVTSVGKQAQLRAYISFKNLRFVGPRYIPFESLPEEERPKIKTKAFRKTRSSLAGYEAQSGAAMAAAKVVDTAVLVGAELLGEAVKGAISDHGVSEITTQGTYDNPSAVQLAYVGDSTAVGSPPTTPIFTPWIKNPANRHAILDYLKRPQFVTMMPINNTQQIFYANPVFPTGYLQGAAQQCTYFRWFSQFAAFWRGTINFHFVILGHPMVEIGYNFLLGYLPDSPSPVNIMDGSGVLRGVCQGVKHIVVPMPFLTLFDHLPIIDNISANVDAAQFMTTFTPSSVGATFNVISTMLDVDPTLQVAVFMSAGDDFTFMQPYAVGLNNVSSDSLSLKLEKKKKAVKRLVKGQNPLMKSRAQPLKGFEPQVNLTSVNETFQTRAKAQLFTDTMPVLKDVEDLMSIWSRCIPYQLYDGSDEPIPDFAIGATSPCWFPMTGGSASYTPDVNNSWYCTNDNLSLLSSQFLFYRGSIALKVCAGQAGDELPVGYKYVTLKEPGFQVDGEFPFKQRSHSPFTYNNSDLPPNANFGNGTVCTPVEQQPVLDITIPYRGPLTWMPCNSMQYDNVYNNNPLHGSIWAIASGYVDHNIEMQDVEGNLYDSVYRKMGDDYGVAVETLLPPPPLWIAKGSHWES